MSREHDLGRQLSTPPNTPGRSSRRTPASQTTPSGVPCNSWANLREYNLYTLKKAFPAFFQVRMLARKPFNDFELLVLPTYNYTFPMDASGPQNSNVCDDPMSEWLGYEADTKGVSSDYVYFKDMNNVPAKPPLEPSPQTLEEWLQKQLCHYIQGSESWASVLTRARGILDEPIAEDIVTGEKPPHNATVAEGVHILPLEDNNGWSLRLFPGSLKVGAYCIDFISNTTGEAVDLPFKTYELYVLPPSNDRRNTTWDSLGASRRPVMTFEANMGIPEAMRRPGEQKYIIRDGQRCRLYGPNLPRPMEFVIPLREGGPDGVEDVDVRTLQVF